MNSSLLGIFSAMLEDTAEFSFGDLFVKVGDSLLTTVLLCFLAHWLLKICIDLGKGGHK